jgi:hypothetical protein
MPSCWDHRHTREERIAESERNQLQKAAQWRAHKAGLKDSRPVYLALLAQEPEETRRMIEALCEKERQEHEARKAAWEAYQKTDEWKAYLVEYGPGAPDDRMTPG